MKKKNLSIHNSKLFQALNLPTICNLNPRSIYNKVNQFKTFVTQEDIDLVFISESWERENLPLENLIKMEDYEVVSNVYQRRGVGGRPAVVVNTKKFDCKDVTNTEIQIPWGVEATWCIITPKNVKHDSKIQKIACCAVYSVTNSRKKSLLHDHISDAYHILSKKYSRGLHFVIAGDTNDLKLDPILNLSSQFKQIVKDWTRYNPPALLDPIITTLHCFYQRPECLAPIDADSDKFGTHSDHRIVVARPISLVNNKCGRQYKKVTVRPITKSGIKKMEKWFIDQSWEEISAVESAHEKADLFQNQILEALERFFPEKTRMISSDDQPWFTQAWSSLLITQGWKEFRKQL